MMKVLDVGVLKNSPSFWKKEREDVGRGEI